VLQPEDKERISIASHNCQKLPPSNLNIYSQALRRAEELTMDVAAAIEEMAEGAVSE